MVKNRKLDAVEEKLWSELRFKNSEKAYATIYNTYAKQLYNYGRGFTPDSNLVKDAIHDLFVRLWKNRSNLGSTSSIKYYLLSAVRREILKKIEKGKRLNLSNNFDAYNFKLEISHEMHLLEVQNQEEISRNLKNALDTLPARQKEAIFLRFYENLSFAEIASLMNVETRSIYKLIYKALDKLQGEIPKIILLLLVTYPS